MSKTAPWLAISCDWTDSDLFDPMPTAGLHERATDGCRLAWMCLLCWVKMQGRGGKAAFRENAFARRFDLSDRSVLELKRRAQNCGSATFEGGIVTIVNWRAYQQKAYKQSDPDYGESPQSEDCAPTRHQAPSTKHPSPPAGAGATTAAAMLRGMGIGRRACDELVGAGVTAAMIERHKGKQPGVIVTALRDELAYAAESQAGADAYTAFLGSRTDEERDALRREAIDKLPTESPYRTPEKVEQTRTFRNVVNAAMAGRPAGGGEG